MTVAQLQAAYLAGEYVVTQDEACAWRIVKTSRSAWYRFLSSDEAPAGLVLRLGRKRLLSLPVLLEWLNALPEREGAGCGGCHGHEADAA